MRAVHCCVLLGTLFILLAHHSKNPVLFFTLVFWPSLVFFLLTYCMCLELSCFFSASGYILPDPSFKRWPPRAPISLNFPLMRYSGGGLGSCLVWGRLPLLLSCAGVMFHHISVSMYWDPFNSGPSLSASNSLWLDTIIVQFARVHREYYVQFEFVCWGHLI